MKEKFIKFLHDKGCYDRFVRFYDPHFRSEMSFEDYLDKYTPRLYVFDAFSWGDDIDFQWSYVHRLWEIEKHKRRVAVTLEDFI